MSRPIAAVCLAGALLLTGCKGDPSKPEYWDKALSSAKRSKDKVRTLEDLRESKLLGKGHLEMLHKRLASEKNGEVRASIARLLAEVKDPSSVGPLTEAIELGNTDSAGNEANKEIANTLGRIGDPKATSALLKLIRSRDNYARIAAIEALAALKAKEAVDPLLELATDEATEPFISKKAIVALGEIGDPKAVPALLKMMVRERKGVSFYVESSFALFQMGTPAADALMAVLKGDDKEFAAWSREKGIKDAGVYAKAAQVLGDLRDPRAAGPLTQRLGYDNEFLDLKLVVRMEAADALGRMRAKDAVKALSGLVTEEEPTARRVFTHALAQVGSRDALPALVKAASVGNWEARSNTLEAIAMIGDERELPVLEKLAKDEEATTAAWCKKDPDEPSCKAKGESVTAHRAAIKAMEARLQAAKECKDDAACWVKHLDAKDEGLRARAALELGRSGKANAAGELIKRLSEQNLVTRLALIQGTSWLVQDSKEAAKAASASLAEVEKQIAAERGKTQFMKVNEDLRRLAVTIRRQST